MALAPASGRQLFTPHLAGAVKYLALEVGKIDPTGIYQTNPPHARRSEGHGGFAPTLSLHPDPGNARWRA